MLTADRVHPTCLRTHAHCWSSTPHISAHACALLIEDTPSLVNKQHSGFRTGSSILRVSTAAIKCNLMIDRSMDSCLQAHPAVRVHSSDRKSNWAVLLSLCHSLGSAKRPTLQCSACLTAINGRVTVVTHHGGYVHASRR